MVRHFQLKNGLKVLLIESRKSPVVSLQAWVRTGSADEVPREAGISHFIEHLLFKGTRKFKMGEIAQLIEGSGGELNAYTSFDQTVFYMTLSRHFLSTGLEALSDMMGFPAFDPAEIDAEREVVIEEMRRGLDSLGRQASQMMFKTAYGGHPYGRPVIGFEKVIRDIRPATIRRYFQDRYNPRNMFLVISGDFDSQEARRLIADFFGELKSFPLRSVKRKKFAASSSAKIKVETSKFEQSIAYIAWPIPKITHEDIPALDLLAFILGTGETSRLVQRLRMKEPLVQGIGASTFTPRDEGLFLISLSFSETDPEKIFQAVLDEVIRLKEDKILDEEIRRAVVNTQSDELYSLETVDGLARKYGNLEFYFQDVRMSERYLKIMRSLTAADLQRVFSKYLKPEKMTMTALVAESRSELKSATQQALREFARLYKKDFSRVKKRVKPAKIRHAAAPRFQASSKPPQIELVKLANGDRLLYRPSFETPVVSVRVATLGGMRAENESQAGLVELVGRTWLGGTGNHSEEELSREIEGLAAGLGPTSGRNSLSLGLDVLRSSEGKMREIWAEVLSSPTFPQEVLERERQMQAQQLKAKKDNPSQVCMNLFGQAMFGSHPYARDPLGTPSTLGKLDSGQLQSWWAAEFAQRPKVISICGATELAPWIEIWKKTSIQKGQKSFDGQLKLQYPRSEVRVYEKLEKEQSHLICGYPGLTLLDERRYALQIIQSVLAGQGGRLFLELRDKNSLAYSVSPLRMEGLDGGYFGAYIGCAPGKVEKALEMMYEQFDRMASELVPEAELDRAKRYLIGRHDIDLQRASSISAAILFNDLYGIDYNEAFESAQKYRAVTAEEVRRVAQQIFKGVPVVALVGPQPFK